MGSKALRVPMTTAVYFITLTVQVAFNREIIDLTLNFLCLAIPHSSKEPVPSIGFQIRYHFFLI